MQEASAVAESLHAPGVIVALDLKLVRDELHLAMLDLSSRDLDGIRRRLVRLQTLCHEEIVRSLERRMKAAADRPRKALLKALRKR